MALPSLLFKGQSVPRHTWTDLWWAVVCPLELWKKQSLRIGNLSCHLCVKLLSYCFVTNPKTGCPVSTTQNLGHNPQFQGCNKKHLERRSHTHGHTRVASWTPETKSGPGDQWDIPPTDMRIWGIYGVSGGFWVGKIGTCPVSCWHIQVFYAFIWCSDVFK